MQTNLAEVADASNNPRKGVFELFYVSLVLVCSLTLVHVVSQVLHLRFEVYILVLEFLRKFKIVHESKVVITPKSRGKAEKSRLVSGTPCEVLLHFYA